jgi:hypothetical protein
VIKIEDMQGCTYVSDAIDLEAALNKRYGSGVNEFWISHDDDDYPVLAIVINQELASLSYFPEAGSPGFKSVGNLSGLKKGEFTKFYINTPTEIHLVLNESIVPVEVAVEAAKEFLADKKLPSPVKWLEL